MLGRFSCNRKMLARKITLLPATRNRAAPQPMPCRPGRANTRKMNSRLITKLMITPLKGAASSG